MAYSWARPVILVAGERILVAEERERERERQRERERERERQRERERERERERVILFFFCSGSSLSFQFLFLPYPSLSSPLLSLVSLFFLSLGDDTKWSTRVDVSLNLNTINFQTGSLKLRCVPDGEIVSQETRFCHWEKRRRVGDIGTTYNWMKMSPASKSTNRHCNTTTLNGRLRLPVGYAPTGD